TAIEEYFCTSPLVRFPRDLHMERAARIGPGILGIVEIAHASLVALNHANTPIIAAEFERPSGGILRCSATLHDCYESNRTALVWSYIDRWERMIVRLHQ